MRDLNSYLKLANGYLKLGNEFETNKYTYYGMLSLVYISQKTVISNHNPNSMFLIKG